MTDIIIITSLSVCSAFSQIITLVAF